MGEGKEERTKVDITMSWEEWRKEKVKVLAFDLGQIAVAKTQKAVVDFSWIESILKRETQYLDILNDLRNSILNMEKQIGKLKDMLEPLEPYLPALKKYAEEQKRLDEERERLR